MQYGIVLLLGIGITACLDMLHTYNSKRSIHDWIARILVRVFLSGGILIFVISSAAVTDAGDAFSLGMVFGLIMYGIHYGSNKTLNLSKNRNTTMLNIFFGMISCAIISMVLWFVVEYVGVLG